MRALVQQRTAESSTVPLSETVPHYVDTVGKGNRIDRFVHIKTCAMRTVCGTKPWAEHALRVINRKEGRARSAEPPMRGTVLESHLADRT
eukprot:5334778-Alexandrium_andersonii.AAC.1